MKYNNNGGPTFKNGVNEISSAINSWKFALQKFGWHKNFKVEMLNSQFNSHTKQIFLSWLKINQLFFFISTRCKIMIWRIRFAASMFDMSLRIMIQLKCDLEQRINNVCSIFSTDTIWDNDWKNFIHIDPNISSIIMHFTKCQFLLTCSNLKGK